MTARNIVIIGPVITSHPQDVEIHQGHCGTLDVSAYGAMPLHYQWYHENSLLHGMLNHVVAIYV